MAFTTKLGHRQAEDDLITSKLAALHFYQLAMLAPKPEDGSFDAEAAQRGEKVFNGPGKWATCHVPPLFTELEWNMYTAKEIGIDEFRADRSPDRRTGPLTNSPMRRAASITTIASGTRTRSLTTTGARSARTC